MSVIHFSYMRKYNMFRRKNHSLGNMSVLQRNDLNIGQCENTDISKNF